MARRAKTSSGVQKAASRGPVKTPRKLSTRRRKATSLAGLKGQLTTSLDELARAREQQVASAEVLRIISLSPGDLMPVFESMLASAMRICEAQCGFIYQVEAGAMRAMAEIGVPPALAEYRRHHLHTGGAGAPVEVMRRTKRPAHVHDARKSDAYRMGNPNAVAGVELGGARTVLYVPMIKDDDIVGVINLYRQEVRPFTAEQIALLEHFAGQAVIAIENARLLKELRRRTDDLAESLQQQTATADVLKVISRSAFELDPVLSTLVASAAGLCEAERGMIFLREGDSYYMASNFGFSSELEAFARANPLPADGTSTTARAGASGAPVQAVDLAADKTQGVLAREYQRLGGHRTNLGVPLLRDGETIGVFTLTRQEVKAFTSRQVELVQTFADQAVIAIQNVKLFEEVRRKTHEVQESLRFQTASADVLKAISRSAFDLQAVLDTLLESACHLSEADIGTIRYKEGDDYRLASTYGCPPEWSDYFARRSTKPDRGSVFGRTIIDGGIVHIPDVLTDREFGRPDAQRLMGFRAALGVPLVREGRVFGVVNLFRFTVSSFTEKQIDLVRTFADQAVIAIENARLFDEVTAKTRDLTEALTYQTGSANILKVIASSPADVRPVLDAIVESACELCDAYDAVLVLKRCDELSVEAHHGEVPLNRMRWRDGRATISGRAIADQIPVHVHDIAAEAEEFPTANEMSRLDGGRTVLGVPMVKDGLSIGAIVLRRTDVQPFSDKQITLLQTFSDQAVIAIENARLFNETNEALERQTATADILKVIASSPSDVQPVFDAIAERAKTLLGGHAATVLRIVDDRVELGALTPVSEEADAMLRASFPITLRDNPIWDSIQRGETSEISDTESEMYAHLPLRNMGRARGFRSRLMVPLRSDSGTIGAISVTRVSPGSFAAHYVELLQTFADQAVIAIENTRLFNEVQAKTCDLQEALQQQTATADLLKVINRSAFDLQKVFETLVHSAAKLCEANFAMVFRRDGDIYRLAANHGFTSEYRDWMLHQAIAIGRGTLVGRTAILGHTIQIPDAATDPEYAWSESISRGGFRTMLGVPLMREGHHIGVIALCRQTVQPFTDRQIQLMETFADQAVIAIENTSLFNEVQTKTRDLQEALTSQIGSANILKVIASSPTDVGPVLNAIVVSACDLCEAYDAVLRLREGEHLRVSAHHGPIPTSRQLWPINRHWTAGRSVMDRGPIQVCDMQSSEGDEFPEGREYGLRTVLSVPLLREGESIGSITLRRTEVSPFSDKQINLLQVFADQAVIAIGNVRLFEEVQERTRELTESLEQQTATAEVLETISSSAGELEPVFNKMLENAVRICGAHFGTMNLYEEGGFRTVALYNAPQAYIETRLYKSIRAHPASGLGTVETTHKTVHIDDIRTQVPYLEDNPNVRALADLAGARTLVIVPMLKEGDLIGTITIFRQEIRPFTEKQTELVASFANQAVIAIENARLLNELRERTEELSQSLEDLRAAQDRLIQTEKLASLGQLTAGIAHEIKNPLNFVNNFASLSAELTEELSDVLKPLALPEKARVEVDDLTGILRGNLDKVVQHGRRADSIVKNMLLHSREGSGEHRKADVNALVEESLNLAYHGARAENSGFTIRLERDLDQAVGSVEVYPQEITRVFLNLISNGFYAASKRASETGDSFEPTLRAMTRNRGDSVEIRICDNGSGIPPDIKEKIFNPFFTTKPAGEGTGLGLSMSHDIVVKQHGGTINVVTESGAFTEFVITLPRTMPTRAEGQKT